MYWNFGIELNLTRGQLLEMNRKGERLGEIDKEMSVIQSKISQGDPNTPKLIERMWVLGDELSKLEKDPVFGLGEYFDPDVEDVDLEEFEEGPQEAIIVGDIERYRDILSNKLWVYANKRGKLLKKIDDKKRKERGEEPLDIKYYANITPFSTILDIFELFNDYKFINRTTKGFKSYLLGLDGYDEDDYDDFVNLVNTTIQGIRGYDLLYKLVKDRNPGFEYKFIPKKKGYHCSII